MGLLIYAGLVFLLSLAAAEKAVAAPFIFPAVSILPVRFPFFLGYAR